jgi:putative nucleotidyltransferase with HDIG domain
MTVIHGPKSLSRSESRSEQFKLTSVVLLFALFIFKAINAWRFPNVEIIPDSVTLVLTIALLIYLWVRELIDRDRFIAMHLDNTALREKIKQSQIAALQTMITAMEVKHPDLRGHCRRVTMLAESIADKLKLPIDEIEPIRIAALLHDIGAVCISDEVFDIKDNLTDRQWEDIKNHPALSAAIISSSEYLQRESAIARSHHERFDGKGYPDALQGEKISLGGRILAVAEAFDAMNSPRAYRSQPLSQQFIMREIRANSGTQFDPRIVASFLELLNEKPQMWSSA